jgi:hypothetical protein
MATKKGTATTEINFFPPLFVVVGSGVRDKHYGIATLVLSDQQCIF